MGDAGAVAAFNVHAAGDRVEGKVCPADVPGLEGERFVIYESITRRAQTVGLEEGLTVSLDANESALYLILPLAGPVTPVGLTDKFIAPAAIADWVATVEKTTIVLFEGGCFSWVAAAPPTEVRINGEVVDVEAGEGTYSVDCSALRGSVWVEVLH